MKTKIEELKALCEKATPGVCERDPSDSPYTQVLAIGNEVIVYHREHGRQADSRVVDNFKLIAALWNSRDALLAVAEAGIRVNDELKHHNCMDHRYPGRDNDECCGACEVNKLFDTALAQLATDKTSEVLRKPGTGTRDMKSHKCNQQGCSQPGVYRFTWPGKDEAHICKDHVEHLRKVANAIGLHLQIRPVKGAQT